MSHKITVSVDELKDKYVTEMFIETADEDYILARWLFLSGMHRQFFWSAAQGLEKYLKAAVLLNGGKFKPRSHDLIGLYKNARLFAENLIPETLQLPEQAGLLPELTRVWGSLNTCDFIERVNINGQASNRYNTFGFEVNTADLYKLDQVVFAFRNIAIQLDRREMFVGTDDSPKELLLKDPTRQLRPLTDKLCDLSTTTPDIYRAANEHNFSFASKSYKHSSLQQFTKASVSNLEILYKNNIAHSGFLRKWLEDNVHLTPNERSALLSRRNVKASA